MSFVTAPAAHADTLSVGPNLYRFYISATNLAVRPGEFINYDHIQDSGGDLQAVLNGESLAGTYCVNLVDVV